MGYNVGNDILDDEFNIFATGAATGIANHTVPNVNSIFGSGDGADIGWGQTIPVSAVTAGQDITATKWASLLNAVNTAGAHQNTTILAQTTPSVGDDIAVIGNLNQNITNCYYNRLNCAAKGTPINSTITRTSGWATQVTCTFTVTFTNFNAMRYFFNTGGHVAINGTRTGGAVNPKNTAWTNFLADIGTLNITAGSGTLNINLAGTNYTGFKKTGGAGTPTTYLTGTGLYQLGGTYTELFRQYSTEYLYEVNYVRLSAKRSGGVLSIEFQYVDAENTPEESVTGNTNFNISAIPASTTYISNTWGTPVIAGVATGS